MRRVHRDSQEATVKATHFSSVLARLVGLGLMVASTISPAFAAEKKSPAKKVETDPANPKHIVNVRGVGYKFVTNPA